jgi:hypothetical protein
MDRTTLEAFTQVLVQEDLRAFQVAMAIISETQREPGETAFPDLGTILAVMRRAEESRWRSLQHDPPADREPVYAPSSTAQPARLTGDRLRIAVSNEIDAIRKTFREENPGAPIDEIFELLPEPQRSRYIELIDWSNDFRTYPLKKALPRPLDAHRKATTQEAQP